LSSFFQQQADKTKEKKMKLNDEALSRQRASLGAKVHQPEAGICLASKRAVVMPTIAD
jgi:hypothetical protein